MATHEGLKVWFHPSMKIPFKMEEQECILPWTPNIEISDLMDRTEALFDEMATQNGKDVELQINVLWNVKNHKKSLSPAELVGKHFQNGDTFGVYGDVLDKPPEREQRTEEEKTPVVILTGFLGSGKTTLLNYILQEQTDKKIAVIENEFGEVSIDDALLKKDKIAMAEKIVVMDNGCMCCTIREDLVDGLMQIVDEIKNGAELDAILIETTGMADPVPIVRTFMSSEQVTEMLRLDGVIALADAKHLCARLDDEVEEGKVNEAFQQIAFADKIILNKLDLVTSEEAIITKDRIRDVNRFAKVLPAVRGRVQLRELWNMRAHDMINFTAVDIDQEAEVDPQLAHCQDEGCPEEHGHGGHGGDAGHAGHGGHGDHAGHGDPGEGHGHAAGHGHNRGHGHGHGDNRHDSRVNSFSIVREGEIRPERLSFWMQALGRLPAERGTIYRIKAILAVKGHPYKHVFHAVMDVSDEDDGEAWGEDEPKISKIVFIGKGLDQQYLRNGFNSIFVE